MNVEAISYYYCLAGPAAGKLFGPGPDKAGSCPRRQRPRADDDARATGLAKLIRTRPVYIRDVRAGGQHQQRGRPRWRGAA
jgi:hypothetical protein